MRSHAKTLLIYSLATLCLAIPLSAAALDYPPSPVVDQVDEYHGVSVPDPYRWLEDITSQPVKDWVTAQNNVSRPYLDAIPGRDRVAERLREVANYERFSSPGHTAGRYFWYKNDGLQNHSVLYWSEGLNGAPKVLLDPNSFSPDGSISLAGSDISDDGKWLLYAKSTAGSDWVEWFVKNIESGEELSDHIQWSKGGGNWNTDASGFFYERYPEPKAEEKYTAAAINPAYYFHRLGTPQSDDELVYSIPEHPDWWIGLGPNEKRDKLLLSTGVPGSDNNDYGFMDLSQPGYKVQWLIPERDAQYSYVHDQDGKFWFWTTKDAPLGKLIQIDAAQPKPANWKAIIPEGRFSLQGVDATGGFLWASYLKDARTQVVQ
jgi:prolyl oligopeptidase